MRFYACFVLAAVLLVLSHSAATARNVVGDDCLPLGNTLMNEQKTDIIACLPISASDRRLKWKSMSSPSVPDCADMTYADYMGRRSAIARGFNPDAVFLPATPNAKTTRRLVGLCSNTYLCVAGAFHLDSQECTDPNGVD